MFGVMQWLRSCDFNSSDSWKNEECTKGVDEVLKQYNEIDIYSLHTSVCFATFIFKLMFVPLLIVQKVEKKG